MHKDTKYQLNNCERYAQPGDRELRDLTENREYAQTVIYAAQKFFRFDFSKVRFSGFAREHDRWDGEIGDYGPSYYVEVWHRGERVRHLGLRSLGILGTLHVDINCDNFEDAVHQDFIGAVGKAINQERDIEDACPRYMTAKLDEHYLYFEIDMVP